jgi:hypothetical protein
MADNDLISRSALIAEHCSGCDVLADGLCDYDVCGSVQLMMEAPAVDAVEVDKAMAWLEGYTMTDTKQIYSKGIVYVPLFRVEQAFVDKAYNGLQES